MWSSPRSAPAAPFPFRPRKQPSYESLFQYVEPGRDKFPVEKEAAQITSALDRMIQTGATPLAAGFRGVSPMPVRYHRVADDVAEAVFDSSDRNFDAGMQKWLNSLGKIRRASFYVLPEGRVRYEIAGTGGGLQYRVGFWKQTWKQGQLTTFEPIEETLVTAAQPLFRDMTGAWFGGVKSFDEQMLRGIPYWRARLDSACGIDVYGNTGIAAGDIDGDGWDEIYVCQPAGLPNRLYKNRNGRMEDITEAFGLGVLDETASALFLDLRNSGRQDLVALTVSGPQLFLNEGSRFRHRADAFRFANAPQGAFTGMAAADYDRDGRVDLYL